MPSRGGVDLDSGFRPAEELPYDYCVGGVMLQRPFKVTKIGPVNLFVSDIDRVGALLYRAARPDQDRGGALCAATVACSCAAATDHHCIGLFPLALRAELGLNASTTLDEHRRAGRDL